VKHFKALYPLDILLTLCINSILLAFAAERRVAPMPAAVDPINTSRLPGPQQQTRHTPRLRCNMGQTDSQTDTVSLHKPCRVLYEQCQKLRMRVQCCPNRRMTDKKLYRVIPTKWRSCRDHRLCDVTSPYIYCLVREARCLKA